MGNFALLIGKPPLIYPESSSIRSLTGKSPLILNITGYSKNIFEDNYIKLKFVQDDRSNMPTALQFEVHCPYTIFYVISPQWL